jgi:hypothetical protein
LANGIESNLKVSAGQKKKNSEKQIFQSIKGYTLFQKKKWK